MCPWSRSALRRRYSRKLHDAFLRCVAYTRGMYETYTKYILTLTTSGNQQPNTVFVYEVEKAFLPNLLPRPVRESCNWISIQGPLTPFGTVSEI